MVKRFASFLLSVSLLIPFWLMATTKEAHAYIDFGSGSLILQTLLASIFGALFTLKIYWRRLTGNISALLSRVKSPKPPRK
jgi:hypothetical protein